jgi:hypothetical protein
VFKERIVCQARTWIGTKFHHQGRLKSNPKNKGGCDCIGLLIGTLKELDYDFNLRFQGFCDEKNYQRIVQDDILLKNIEKFFKKKNLSKISSGDIALFSFSEKLPSQHIGIIGEHQGNLTLIHAYLKIGYVVEHFLDDYWKKYLFGVYEI